MIQKFLAMLLLSVFVQDDLLWEKRDETVHFRATKDRYDVHLHSLNDRFGTTKTHSRPVFRVSISRAEFSDTPKWNNRLEELPLSKEQAEKILVDFASKVFVTSEEVTWKLQRMGIYSVSEPNGDFLWLGEFSRFPNGSGTSWVPTITLYLKMDGKLIKPQPSRGQITEFRTIFRSDRGEE